MLEGERAKDVCAQSEGKARDVSLRMLFLLAHPLLQDVANFVRGKRREAC